MYTGHLGVALAARRYGAVPLWGLILASQAPDWIAIAVGAAGVEDPHQLWSHSIPAVLVGVGVAVAVGLRGVGRGRSAILLGAVYLSHPLLDLITGLKPTWPGGPSVGLCLYDVPAGDFLLEALIVIGGLLLYRRTLGESNRTPVLTGMLVITVLCQGIADATHAYRLGPRSGSIQDVALGAFPSCG